MREIGFCERTGCKRKVRTEFLRLNGVRKVRGNPADEHQATKHDERVELREFRYTRIQVTLRRDADGNFTETARELAALRLNPWWFPHDRLYTPANDNTGGPFTIGRVIHSSRGVGFTGWIGGVAVFNRALRADEINALTTVAKQAPVFTPSLR